jgi:diguanylate cyclase (GGDEF)-like protein
VLLAFLTLLTLANSRLSKGTKGSHWFTLYSLCALLGALAVALRGQIPGFLSIVGGNLFVTAGYFFLFISLADLFGFKIYNFYLQICLLLTAVITMLEYGYIHPDTKNRLIAYSIVLACQQGQIALLIFRKEDEELRIAGGTMAVMLSGLFFSNFIRVLGVFYQGAPSNYLQAGPFLAWILIANSGLQCGAMVAYVWMTAALLRHDLQVQASTDPLTGLLNRRAIELAAERGIAECKEARTQICAIVIDLDGFKQINDTYGHHCGDATLIAVTSTLQRGLRKNDLLARVGGDEFAVLLPCTSMDEAMEIAERLRYSIETMDVVYGQVRTKVTASFGLAQVQTSAPNWEQLVMSCDKALYEVKKVGGNRAVPEARPKFGIKALDELKV